VTTVSHQAVALLCNRLSWFVTRASRSIRSHGRTGIPLMHFPVFQSPQSMHSSARKRIPCSSFEPLSLIPEILLLVE
jgi:hypothetical protein